MISPSTIINTTKINITPKSPPKNHQLSLMDLEAIIQKKLEELSKIPHLELSNDELKGIIGFIESNKKLISSVQKAGGGFIRHNDVLSRSLYISKIDEVYINCKKHQQGSHGVGKGNFKSVTQSLAYNQNACFVNAVTKIQTQKGKNDSVTKKKDIDLMTRYEAKIGSMLRGMPNIAQFHEVIYYRAKRKVNVGCHSIHRERKQSVMMPYYSGGDLQSRVFKGSFTIAETYQILKGLLVGLTAIHEAGIIHRDIKLENIWLDDQNNPMIGDFGLATEASDKERIAIIAGSPLYISPEAWYYHKSINNEEKQTLFENLSAKMDVYALGLVFGVLLFQLQPQFNPFTRVYNEHYHRMKEPEDLTLEHLVWLMTRPDPAKRITSKEALTLLEERFADDIN